MANKAYWGGAPRLSSITFRFSKPEDAPKLLAAGKVDALLQPATGASTQASGRAVVSRPAQSVYLLLSAAGTDEWALLQDENVRKAVALALDKDRFTTAP